MTVSKEVARVLLDIEAITLSPAKPYTWASGLRSPIYCDNRLIMSYPEVREKVAQAMATLIEETFGEVDVIAGTATAGIPHAAFISQILKKPMVYVRSSAKSHGKQHAIEGRLPEGSKVVMIEDLISTGKSVIQAADMVTQAGGQVLGCCAIFNYLLPSGKEAFAKTNYPLVTLTDYLALLDEAMAEEAFRPYRAALEEWYKDPVAWSEKHGQ